MGQGSIPISVICIIATEFWERFSFCGLRTILSLYLRNELQLAEGNATIVYHVFIMVCYVIPIVGAICADSYIGRYRTIVYFSVVYVVGNVLMIFAAVPTLELSPMTLTIIGLSLIAIGTGGTKPCVAAFGGDQFIIPSQERQLQQYFSSFYLSINLGGFIGMILTPMLRKVTCFGDETCYALGFGFPAFLMVISLVLFVIGKPWYKIKHPKGNVMVEFLNCVLYAQKKRCQTKDRTKIHWLDHARPKYNMKLIHDMKTVFAVLFLYVPLPLFWSLFDQQGSSWTFQASRMDGFFLGFQIVPDQMQVINPFLMLILIPIFDKYLYPWLGRHHIMQSHLHRMAVGGFIAGLAFFSAGLLELVLQQHYPDLPGHRQASLNVINTLPCRLKITNPFNGLQMLNSSEKHFFRNVPAHNNSIYGITVMAPLSCGDLNLQKHFFEMNVSVLEYQIDTILIGINENNEILRYITDPVDFKRSLSGRPRLRLVYLRSSNILHNITISLENSAGLTDVYYLPYEPPNGMGESGYLELPPDFYRYSVSSDENKYLEVGVIHIALGGVYTLVLREGGGLIKFAKLYTMSPPNHINIMWLLPQYFLISVAEIMFGIAGLEFSFTQAPKSMKTITIAAWYLSVAFGNLMVILITQANLFKTQANGFFLFAILIVADMMIFMQIASYYTYVQLEADSSVYLLDHNELTPLLPDCKMLTARPEENEDIVDTKNNTTTRPSEDNEDIDTKNSNKS